MTKTKKQQVVKTENNENDIVKMYLSDLSDFDGKNQKVRMFSHVSLLPGETVEYHVHNDEFESYYILSGNALYNDNGKELHISEGTVTFTPSGEGHGITNIGENNLEFIALIVLD